MKKFFAIILVAVLVVTCTSKKEGNMVVQGTIKGLKKGKLYLQKVQDTVLVTVDSVALLGENQFKLTANLVEPALYYLVFDGNTTHKSILFFGEEGIITINDSVDQFGYNPEISGSKNQKILEGFIKINKRFQNQRLDLIQSEFNAKKNNDTALLNQLELDYQRMIKRKVLFTTNFAINNADSEVAPYLGLTQMYDATLQMLDTVNNSLSDKIKSSKYGKKFQEYISKVKAIEKE